MTTKKVKDLPEGEYQKILASAEKRAQKLVTDETDPNSLLIIGLADMIAELRITQKIRSVRRPRRVGKPKRYYNRR